VQDAGAPAGGERRAVATAGEALAGRLDADQLDAVVVDERGEVPIELEPPPTQAITREGRRPVRSSNCARASSPIVRWKFTTIAG